MKKIYINKTLPLLALMLIAIIGCSDEDFNGDDRLEGRSELYVYHVNPKTGLEYTNAELAELEYDPRHYESYSESQPIELAVVTQAMPQKIEVVSGADNSVLAEINNFTEIEGGYKSSFYTTNVTQLGLEEFDKVVIVFNVTYADSNQSGYANPPMGKTSIVIQRLEGRAPSVPGNEFVFLVRKNQGTLRINTADAVTSKVKDPYVGSILNFDGVDDQVEINDNNLGFRGNSSYSVGIWVNTTATNSDPSIIGDKDWNGGANKGFVFAYLGSNWKLNIGDGSNRADLNGTAINDGNWHYLMATIDRAGDVTIYQDGVAISSADISGLNGADMSSGMPVRIGQDGTGSYGSWYNGMVGDVTFYDYALTASEASIAARQYSGAVLKTQSGLTKTITVTNNGALTTSEAGRFTYEFDGSNYASLEMDSDLDFRHNGDFTISTWINTSATNSDPSFLSDKDWNGGSNKGFVLAFLGSNWKLNAGDGSNRIDINGDVVNDGNWHMITATFDRSGNCSIYQDAQFFASVDMSSIGDMNSGLPIRIGQDGTGTYGVPFTGKVANTMIFDYVLTPEEVEDLY